MDMLHGYYMDIYTHLRVSESVDDSVNVLDAARAKPAKRLQRTRSPAFI